jgi:hypothetical protein
MGQHEDYRTESEGKDRETTEGKRGEALERPAGRHLVIFFQVCNIKSETVGYPVYQR